jgi:hypothetical protein
MAGIGEGLEKAGNAFLDAALAKQGLQWRREQGKEQKSQFEKLLELRQYEARTRRRQAMRSRVSDPEYYSDMSRWLEPPQSDLSDLGNVRPSAAGYRERQLVGEQPTTSETRPRYRGAGLLAEP